jgi:hypothetical protein
MVERVKVEVASGRGVAERWRSQYQQGGKWTRTVSGDSELVYNKLCDLGQNPDIDAVSEVIGNKGWSYLSCTSCGEYVKRAADLTRTYSDNHTLICRPCLEDAIRAMDAG